MAGHFQSALGIIHHLHLKSNGNLESALALAIEMADTGVYVDDVLAYVSLIMHPTEGETAALSRGLKFYLSYRPQ